jgi:hypothetical protein
VKINWLLERDVIVTDVLSSKVTVAAELKFEPERVTVNGRSVLTCFGCKLAAWGTEFRIWTVALALLLESAWLTALMVTVLEEGTIAGAMYFPAWSMVPRAGLPPLTPFTDQVTA